MVCLPHWRDDGILLVGEIGTAAGDELESYSNHADIESMNAPSVGINGSPRGRRITIPLRGSRIREPVSSAHSW